MSLLLAVLTPFLGAPLVAWAARGGRAATAWCAAAVTALAALWLIPLLPATFAGATAIERLPWIPAAGLDLAFRLDGLGLLFALLILGIGLLVILYAHYYLSAQDSLGRLYACLLLFMGSMLGVVLSENLIQLLIFWELTSLSSFLLIAYWRRRAAARRGARMALTITGAGGLALLAGFLLLGDIAGSYELSAVLARGDAVRADPRYATVLALVLLGAFTKSAQFPFHFWLPHAMTAPTPVSAYLHSATMVKAGVFLLARLFPVLSGTPEWTFWVGGTGLVTLLLGAVVALFRHDLKGLLAYSTISHLGLIVALFGVGTPLAAVAGVFHLINHAIFKAGLFMAAGIIDHECGTRDMRRVNGMWKYMPYTAVLAMVAAAAMAGVPLFNGFLSKEMFFAEAVAAGGQMRNGWLLPLAVTVAGIFAVAYSLRFIHDVFFNGEPVDLPKTPHEPPLWMRVPVMILVTLCVLVGVFPALTVEPILSLAAGAVLQAPPPAHDLAIWHGVSPALWMSVIALLGGALLYSGRRPLFALQQRMEGSLDARAVFERVLAGAARRGAAHHRAARQRLAAAPGRAVHRRGARARRRRPVFCRGAADRPASAAAGGRRERGGRAGARRGRARRNRAASPAPERADPHGAVGLVVVARLRQVLRARSRAHATLGRGGHHRAAAAGAVFPAAEHAGGIGPGPPLARRRRRARRRTAARPRWPGRC